jgi:hypothetical protein
MAHPDFVAGLMMSATYLWKRAVNLNFNSTLKSRGKLILISKGRRQKMRLGYCRICRFLTCPDALSGGLAGAPSASRDCRRMTLTEKRMELEVVDDPSLFALSSRRRRPESCATSAAAFSHRSLRRDGYL